MKNEIIKLINELYATYTECISDLKILNGREKWACKGYLNCLEKTIKSLLKIMIEEN